MSQLKLALIMTLAGCLVLLGGCASRPAASLYEQLGGQGAIESLVDEILVQAHEDERISALFVGVDLPYLKDRLVEQLCQATGGPCEYTGLPMDEAHAGMRVSDDEFDFFVEDLVAAMEALSIDAAAQQQIAELLLPMRPDIVGK
jgi:hemoglobin